MLRRISLVVVALGMLALPASSLAQATRTWVSGVGDDANPCSRTAPCKTFAGAISKTAAGGEIDALDDGGFGALTITKSITIDGGGHTAGVLVSGTNGFVISAAPTDRVIIRNLDFDGLGPAALSLNGIKFLSGQSLLVENVKIFGFGSSNGTDGNGIFDNSSTDGSSLVVENSTISDNARDGVLIAPQSGAAQATLTNDSLESNLNGLSASMSAGASRVTVSLAGSSVSSNASSDGLKGTGVLSDGSQTKVFLSNDSVFGNVIGLQSLNGGSIISVGGTNAVYGNGTDGSPTSTTGGGANAGGSGPVGPPGPQGPRGLVGLQGPAGKVVLVTCTTQTKKVKLRHHKTRITKVQNCTAKPVDGPVTFTLSGHLARATLARDGKVYASGRFGLARDSASGYLRSLKPVGPARYVLTLWRGRHVISRQSVRIG